MIHVVMTHLGRRSGVARADTRRAHHTHARYSILLQGREQFLGAGQHAAETVTNAYCHRLGPGLPVRHHVEVGVERGYLVDLGHRDLEQLR